ncbi:MAG TPA: hypothetical protein DCR81_06260 [Smithella sp.]|nr:hypothetical protein [Smithella sp.]
MIAKTSYCFVCIVVSGLFMASQLFAQTFSVKNSPRPFTVVAPTSWVQQPTTTGNSRIKFASPSGTPAAECAVIVQEYPSAKNIPQSTLDKGMAEGLDPSEITSQLSSLYNNVKIFSVGVGNIAGHPAQFVNCQYSVGTPTGEIWARGILVTAATTPGLIWTISCGALGKNAAEAQKGYSYWQLEIVKFPTNIKIVK